ncbi:MAG: 5'-deoxynucleotidase [Oscillospiraceae bacterium]|nr:5'-deoxynucleotidase [Oscillospiraceae bacterium]MCC8156528.1 5'-deoxynucleotidase [Oscillospiraceae bacterium]MCD7934960.1 5'-deoxynucleotidase [Oscillospiraceae bacterium]MCD8128109.1 5'-deoxynucleotidase [Oscillospiraceae bacterium]MCD8239964.1 5'-deoxynucleotidase [Oscillospiraceae bacterium]
MSYDFFAYISRMKYIARWSLMRSTVQENVQEHSHMVAVLAHALGLIRRDVFGHDCDPDALAAAALYHDAPEILTGDLPSPIKYHSSDIKRAYDEVERLAVEKLLLELPEALRPAYRALLSVSPETHEMVKAADRLSAYIKCVEERKAGNHEFLSAEAASRQKLEELHMPEMDYFLEHFLPGIEKTLDELGTLE